MIETLTVWFGDDHNAVLAAGHVWRAAARSSWRLRCADAVRYPTEPNRRWLLDHLTEGLGIFNLWEASAVYLTDPESWKPAYVAELLGGLDRIDHPVHVGIVALTEPSEELDCIVGRFADRLDTYAFYRSDAMSDTQQALVEAIADPACDPDRELNYHDDVLWFEVERRVRAYIVLSTLGVQAALGARLVRSGQDAKLRAEEARRRPVVAWRRALLAVTEGARLETCSRGPLPGRPGMDSETIDRVRVCLLRDALVDEPVPRR